MTIQSRMTRMVRPSPSGLIAIPIEFREELGIGEQSMLQMTLAEGELRIKPVLGTENTAGSPWLRDLYEDFAAVREEILARGISEEELFADIDDAVAAVRAERRANRQ